MFVKQKSNIILLFICFIIGACSNNASQEQRHEQVQTYHSNGNLATETSLLEGIKDGSYKEWFPSGDLQLERNYKNGELVTEKLFTKEGDIIKNIVIKDGRKYGLLFSSFCSNGIASNPNKDTLIFKSSEK